MDKLHQLVEVSKQTKLLMDDITAYYKALKEEQELLNKIRKTLQEKI
jgi:hypothetical protein